MPGAVQLDVDGETEARLGELGGRLERIAGLGTTRRSANVHHVTLGIYDRPPTDEFMGLLAVFAGSTTQIGVQLSSIGIFPGDPSTLFLAPVATEQLLVVHTRFHTTIRTVAGNGCTYYRPGAWVPHVTVSMNETAAALHAALAQIAERWTPAPARLDVVRLIELPSARTLYKAKLADDRTGS